eukprot:CAMPEP_0197182504 /NCGR_PEP_ID=MMETSP1423-20130617/6431_1 /TAXON_ID=476441 /ORGANISM="Pseudo-nitzschia heimii, Strain UNC1101" /LENGTH=765 /DNA_ID=CAMNT_0042632935 /DNA_START=493 /DNA_END=2790 /DNA_ORIENTATION=+
MHGVPSAGMTASGRTNVGYNSFNNGRGRVNIPGRNLFGGRNDNQQRLPPPPPPPPPRGSGIGQTVIFPPPPSIPQLPPHLPSPDPNSQPFLKEIRSQSSSYGGTPALVRGNQVQHLQNTYQLQHQQKNILSSQQHEPRTTTTVVPSSISHDHLQVQQQPPLATKNNSYGTHPQVNNPSQKSYNQIQFQTSNTSVFHSNLQLQPSSTNASSTNLSTATVTASSDRKVEEAWKEYTAPGGLKYYYNEISKVSTYHKPDALKQDATLNRVGAAVTGSSSTNSSSKKRTWQEHQDVSTGRKYYSDGVKTTWEKPEDFVSPDTIVANTSALVKREEQNLRENSTRKKKKGSNGDEKINVYSNKKEATTAFKGFLLAKGISPTMKWNEVLKVCESDPRWDSYDQILSLGERRQALAEYQTKRTNEIRNEQRQERIRAKEAFGQLLTDVLRSISGFSARTSRFEDVRNTLSKDDRFFAVEDESTRESLFLDFCDDFKKREERTKRNRKREAQESFVSFLQEREEGGTLTYASTWESFLISLSEEEKIDSRFVVSKSLSNSDRELHFADFVIGLQKVEDDKRRRIQDARRRAEKAQRDQYRELLCKMATDKIIFPYSRWREVEDFLVKEDSYKLVESQDRVAPREIFEVFVEEWDSLYRRERNFLLRLLRSPSRPDIVISAVTTFEDFKKIIAQESAYSSDIQNEAFRIFNRREPVSTARLLFDELTVQTVDAKRHGSRRGSTNDDSSEDEGEIIEDGEVVDGDCKDKSDKRQ